MIEYPIFYKALIEYNSAEFVFTFRNRLTNFVIELISLIFLNYFIEDKVVNNINSNIFIIKF